MVKNEEDVAKLTALGPRRYGYLWVLPTNLFAHTERPKTGVTTYLSHSLWQLKKKWIPGIMMTFDTYYDT